MSLFRILVRTALLWLLVRAVFFVAWIALVVALAVAAGTS